VKLIRRADIAMYAAKRARSGYAVYCPQLDPHSSDRLALGSDLRGAIEAGELSVHYQPKALLAGRALAGVEALVRWSHPVRGMLSPAEFIPLAEHTGLMGPLTSHVLRSALAQVRDWLNEGLEVAVAVNVAPRSLLDPRFPAEVARALRDSGVPAHLLELEVTEDSMLEDPDLARETLKELSAMGVSIAIDDFGTGFSSLSQLKTLPVGTLKIDRSFVSGMCGDARDAFIVRAAIRLGHDLGMSIVAEGVEDEETFSLLAELRCDAVQGYLTTARRTPPRSPHGCGRCPGRASPRTRGRCWPARSARPPASAPRSGIGTAPPAPAPAVTSGGMDDEPPLTFGRIMAQFTRRGLPLVIGVCGVALIVVGGDTYSSLASPRSLETACGVALLIVALMVWMINWLLRLGVASNADRDEEERAREYFDRTGRWPEDDGG
jgi:EAL domain-containing protein (putative c-di-GMP-specific phosphodiesterase class I)